MEELHTKIPGSAYTVTTSAIDGHEEHGFASEAEAIAHAKVESSAGVKFFVHDLDGDFEVFDTEEEAKNCVQEALDYWRNEGWPNGTPSIHWGVLMGGVAAIWGSPDGVQHVMTAPAPTIATQSPSVAVSSALTDKFRMLVAACNRIDEAAEEFVAADGLAMGVSIDDWDEFTEALTAARKEAPPPPMVIKDPDVVAVVNAAVLAERTACADLVRQLRDSINEMSLRASAMRDSLEQAEKHIRARGKAEVKAAKS